MKHTDHAIIFLLWVIATFLVEQTLRPLMFSWDAVGIWGFILGIAALFFGAL